MLPQSDYEEFQRIIRGSKYSPHQFEISTSDYIDRTERLYVNFTTVHVRYLPTSITRTYLAGFSGYWLRKLEEDLESGVYDAPTGVPEKVHSREQP